MSIFTPKEIEFLNLLIDKNPNNPPNILELQNKLMKLACPEPTKANTKLSWIYDSKNALVPLKNFIKLPVQDLTKELKVFFPQEEIEYIRIANILAKNGYHKVHQLLELTVFSFNCIRRVGPRTQEKILNALLKHSEEVDKSQS
ncbi:hypothetical protein SAMN05428961_11313 [Paenibacillus sp. OK060]|uniref:hypothetical protein n=1 Tax=Paenibacillus sp. OK060 TaxID=1881034 RepID=UPI000884306A|nr:hypothetical protein [Paenibacillus sp. OK060]SDM29657.1 hypothetical protein SAMN05428961_11313 [Paenibacillus sp. OK060]